MGMGRGGLGQIKAAIHHGRNLASFAQQDGLLLMEINDHISELSVAQEHF